MEPKQNKPDPIDVEIGRRVRVMRCATSKTQAELSNAVGVSFQQIQKYEKGDNHISASKLWDIANFLGEDISYFFNGLGAVVRPK